MDLQTEQAVWRRVRGPGNMTAEEAVLPERLEALILEQQSLAAAQRELARRMRGSQSAAMSRMAGLTMAQARELIALHYMLTGRALRLQTPRPQLPGPMPEALRETWQRLRQTTRTYESLETEFGDYANDFSRFSRQTRDHARALMEVMQQLQSNRGM